LVREATAQPTEPAVSSTELPSMDPARREHVLRVLRSNPPPSAPTRVIPVRFPDSGCSWYAWLAIAACVVFLLGAALWLLGNSSRPRRVALVESEPARASEEPAKLGRRESLGETVTVAQSPGRRGAPASSAAAMSPEAEEARDAVSTVEEVGQTFRFYDSRAVNDAPPPAPPEFRRTARGRSQEPGPPRANSIVPQLRIPAQQ